MYSGVEVRRVKAQHQLQHPRRRVERCSADSDDNSDAKDDDDDGMRMYLRPVMLLLCWWG
jgi:hypothetical protein